MEDDAHALSHLGLRKMVGSQSGHDRGVGSTPNGLYSLVKSESPGSSSCRREYVIIATGDDDLSSTRFFRSVKLPFSLQFRFSSGTWFNFPLSTVIVNVVASRWKAFNPFPATTVP